MEGLGLGDLTEVFPADPADAVVGRAGVQERRRRLLPARPMRYFLLGRALFCAGRGRGGSDASLLSLLSRGRFGLIGSSCVPWCVLVCWRGLGGCYGSSRWTPVLLRPAWFASGALRGARWRLRKLPGFTAARGAGDTAWRLTGKDGVRGVSIPGAFTAPVSSLPPGVLSPWSAPRWLYCLVVTSQAGMGRPTPRTPIPARGPESATGPGSAGAGDA
ncbi:transposase domain-containing protein [Streptomyces vinaceus]